MVRGLAGRVGVACAWIAFVGVTERWRPWSDQIRLVYATDAEQYARIANAAPGFPSVKVDAAHADRYMPHWLIGEIAHGLGVGIHPVYRVATILVVLATLAVVDRTLRHLQVPLAAYALAFGAVAASAYPVRYLLDSPGMVTDALFVLGLAVTVDGLVRRHTGLVVFGLLVATFGRESGVVVAAVLALVWLWQRRYVAAAAAFVLPLALYLVADETSRSFSQPGRGLLGMTVAGGWTAHSTAAHVGRVAVSVAVPAALLVLAWRRGRRGVLLVPLLLGASVVGQALILAPDWSHAEPRLAGLGLPALAVSAAPALAAGALRAWETVLGAVGVALASFHHIYSNIGVTRTSEWGALVAVGCVLLLVPAVRTPAPVRQPESESPPPPGRRGPLRRRATPR